MQTSNGMLTIGQSTERLNLKGKSSGKEKKLSNNDMTTHTHNCPANPRACTPNGHTLRG